MRKTTEELKAAYEAATPGEWAAPGFNSQGGRVACLLDNSDGLRLVSGNFKRSDANFIALAHNLMPTLLEAVEALKAYNDASDLQFATDSALHDNAKAILEKLK